MSIFTKSSNLLSTETFNNRIGIPFFEIQELDSTNNYALDLVKTNLSTHGSAYFAHIQTAGRGQHKRSWHSLPNSNIILSVVIDVSFLEAKRHFLLSSAVALAVQSFFASIAGEETSIKWVNDIFWRDRKAGGLLIELSNGGSNEVLGENKKHWAVVGIGINVNQTSFPDDLKHAVSLKQITGKTYDTLLLARQLCDYLELYYHYLRNQQFDFIIESYNKVLYRKGQLIRLKKDAVIFECLLDGVDVYGQLYVKYAAKEKYNFGEVQLMPWLDVIKKV